MRYAAAKILGLLLALSFGGACTIETTTPIKVQGKTCLEELEKLNLNGRRIGCLIFRGTGSVFATTFQESPDGGPFFLCPSTDPSTCAQSLATHPEVRSSQQELSATVAFAPVSFPATLPSPSAFLPKCQQIFATKQPFKPSCFNTKGSEKKDMKECWYIFSLKYTYATSSMKCERWQP